MTLQTALTRVLRVDFPFVLSAMDMASGALQARAVIEAGGFGFLSASYGGSAWLSAELALLAPWAQKRGKPFGVGFTTWALARQPTLLDLALTHRPSAVWLAAGAPKSWLDRIHAVGALAVCEARSETMAEAALGAGADILVVQATDEGGPDLLPGSAMLLPRLAELASARVPLIAAGASLDGGALAAALTLGASGVTIGVDRHVNRYVASRTGSLTAESQTWKDPDGYKAFAYAEHGKQFVPGDDLVTRSGLLQLWLRGELARTRTIWPERAARTRAPYDALNGLPANHVQVVASPSAAMPYLCKNLGALVADAERILHRTQCLVLPDTEAQTAS
jgi:hypothetical protein